MNSANLDSPRLQHVLSVLGDGLEHSTLEIVTEAHVRAVNSAVAELRDNGVSINCERRGDVWIYRKTA